MSEHVCKCPEGGHSTFGACMRAKGIRVGWARSAAGFDLSKEKRHESELQSYRDARRQGVQPETTKGADIDRAMRASDEVGVAYGA